MNTNLQLLVLGICIAFVSCKNVPQQPKNDFIATIDSTFSVSGQLKFKQVNKFNIAGEYGGCVIDGSVLWHFEQGKENYGYCHDLESGKELNVIAMKGRAANQLSNLEWFDMTKDSVSLYESTNVVKTFAKKDILGDVPAEKRVCSTVTIPKDILVSRMTKLPDGSVVATIRPAVFDFEKGYTNKANEASVIVAGRGGMKTFTTINPTSLNVEKAKNNELPADELVKWAYAQGCIAVKDNNTAVFSVSDQFILYVLDLKTGKVTAEKRYTDIVRDGGEMTFATTNQHELSIRDMKANDKYIVCEVDGYFSEEDKIAKERKKALFVFDWQLNPVKRFDLAFPLEEYCYYRIANDCTAVYFCKQHSRNGLTLRKAELNI